MNTATANAVVQTGPAVRMTPEAYVLHRLHRLVQLGALPYLSPVQRRQVNHALYSTYWDCVGLGIRDRAAAILELPPQR